MLENIKQYFFINKLEEQIKDKKEQIISTTSGECKYLKSELVKLENQLQVRKNKISELATFSLEGLLPILTELISHINNQQYHYYKITERKDKQIHHLGIISLDNQHLDINSIDFWEDVEKRKTYLLYNSGFRSSQVVPETIGFDNYNRKQKNRFHMQSIGDPKIQRAINTYIEQIIRLQINNPELPITDDILKEQFIMYLNSLKIKSKTLKRV